MILRHLILTAALVALASPAMAVVKVYNADAVNGIPGDVAQYTTGLCPPIDQSPGILEGSHTLSDTGGGSVTMTDFVNTILTIANFDTTELSSTFGPGAFVFVNGDTQTKPSLPNTGTGSTAPSGGVAWGVISGWQQTGFVFCISSPQTICTNSAFVHGTTIGIGSPASPTYDLGTWSFDADGDLTATSYITGTSMGGLSNRQSLIRGAYVGAAVPALPLIGAGALALGLLAAGTRSVIRKK